jgi:hypothetical protein
MRLPVFIVPCLFIPWASPAQASAPAKAARVLGCWLSKSKAHGQVGPLKGFPASMSPGQVAECLSTISRRPSLVDHLSS